MVWSAFVPATVGAITPRSPSRSRELLRVALSGGEDGLMEVSSTSPLIWNGIHTRHRNWILLLVLV